MQPMRTPEAVCWLVFGFFGVMTMILGLFRWAEIVRGICR